MYCTTQHTGSWRTTQGAARRQPLVDSLSGSQTINSYIFWWRRKLDLDWARRRGNISQSRRLFGPVVKRMNLNILGL